MKPDRLEEGIVGIAADSYRQLIVYIVKRNVHIIWITNQNRNIIKLRFRKKNRNVACNFRIGIVTITKKDIGKGHYEKWVTILDFVKLLWRII